MCSAPRFLLSLSRSTKAKEMTNITAVVDRFAPTSRRFIVLREVEGHDGAERQRREGRIVHELAEEILDFVRDDASCASAGIRPR